MNRFSLSLFLATILLAAPACQRKEGPLPYAFESIPEQAYRFELNDEISIDGAPVSVQRVADLRLIGSPLEDARLDFTLQLERYYMRVEGAPSAQGGTTELAISEKGVVTSGTAAGDVRLVPGDERVEEGLLRGFLDRPIGGCVLDVHGGRLGTSWGSQNPLLAGVDVLDWVLLALPFVARDSDAWSGERSLPKIGQYLLGINIPIRYEPSEDGQGVRGTGFVRRARLEIAPGLSGAVQIDYAGEATLDAGGRIVNTGADLLFVFEGEDGTRVSSRHKVELRCSDCDTSVNPAAPESDTSSG